MDATHTRITNQPEHGPEPRDPIVGDDFFRLERDGETGILLADEGRCGRLRIGPRELPYGKTSTFRYAEIYELWVHENWRRRGIGANRSAEPSSGLPATNESP